MLIARFPLFALPLLCVPSLASADEPSPDALPSLPPAAEPPAAPAPVEASSPPAPMVAPLEAPPPVMRPAARGAYTHDRFYLRFAIGFGGTALQPTGGVLESGYGGGAMAIELGGSPARGFVVGGGLRVASAGDVGVVGASFTRRAGHGVLGPFVDWFPDPHGGWHLGAMPGLGIVGIDDPGPHRWSTTAFGVSVFGGYDAWVSRELSLGVETAITGTTRSELLYGGREPTGTSVAPISFSLQFSVLYH